MTDFVGFDDWSKRGVWGSPARFVGPAQAAIIHHSVTRTDGRNSFEQAQDIEEVIWDRRFDSGFSMTAYSWHIARSGQAFEGRGDTYRNGANNRDKPGSPPFDNGNTISICFAGNYHPGQPMATLVPTSAQFESASRLISHAIAAGSLVPDPQVLPHSALHGTACCGDELRTRLSRINVKGPRMALHPDAQRAKALGFWDGKPSDLDPDERAAIMAFRSYDLAVEESDDRIAKAISGLVAASPASPEPADTETVLSVVDATGLRVDMHGPITVT